MKQPQFRGKAPDSAIADSQAEYRQHQEDADLLEEIQAERLREQADDLCMKAKPLPSPQQQAQELQESLIPTDQQQQAIDGIVAWCRAHSTGIFGSFVGPAGCGKTTVARWIYDALTAAGFDVGSGAPTHKACAVLARNIAINRDDVSTVASILALKEKKVGAKRTFVPDYRKKPRVSDHQIWLIDESSMLSADLLAIFEDYADFDTRILCIGDPAQLSPVEGKGLSPALKFDPTWKVDQVLRHGGAILDSATAIRQTTGKQWRPQFPQTVITDDSSVFTYKNHRELQHAFVEKAIAHHEGNPDQVRWLVFMNRSKDRMNTVTRRAVHQHFNLPNDPFVVGERLITGDSIKNPDDPQGLPLYGSSRELIVLQAEKQEFLLPACAEGKSFVGWQLVVKATDAGPDAKAKIINALDPSDQSYLDNRLQLLAREAKTPRGSWDEFWELKEFWAELQPHWAMTTHKAQGSQFAEVFLDPDLDKVRAIDERRRIWYTAFTRAQQAIHLVADQEVGC